MTSGSQTRSTFSTQTDWVIGKAAEKRLLVFLANVAWMHGGAANASAYGADNEVDQIASGILEVDLSNLHTACCDRQGSGVIVTIGPG